MIVKAIKRKKADGPVVETVVGGDDLVRITDPIANSSNSSRGWIFDLVNSIANDLALTNHLHEAFYGAHKDAEEGVEGASQKLVDYKKLMDMTLANRRKKMNILKEQAEAYDKKMWCPLKHAVESYMESMEVWQASESKETFEAMIASTDILAGTLSLFLGMDLEICARCLNDAMAG